MTSGHQGSLRASGKEAEYAPLPRTGPLREYVRRSQSEGSDTQRPLRRTICRPEHLTRSLLGKFKVSPVSRSAEQLILNNVNRMGYLVPILLMEDRKVKELTGNRSRKPPTFRFLLGKPKRHHTLNFCAFHFFCGGKPSFDAFLWIGQNVYSSRTAQRVPR